MIKLKNVAYYDKTKPILRDINFTMNAQERVGIVGESGSGKTTLAHILLRLILPTKGQYETHNLTMLPIFQHAIESFNIHLTLAQSLAEPQKYYNKSINSNIDKTLQHLMVQLNLDPELLQAKPYQLSGGQLQRFNILRTLMLQPEILICDEITSNLDVMLEQQMRNVLLAYYEEMHHGMIIISHDLAFITATVERIIVMHDGQIVDDFHKNDLFSAKRHPYTQQLLAVYDVD